MKEYFLIAILFFSVVGSGHAGEPRWLSKMREVRLLEHNYSDVLRILGRPIDGTSEPEFGEYFSWPEGRYFVYFSSGLCVTTDYSEGKPIGWKVPAYTAIGIDFEPKGKIRPAKLGLEFSSFKKVEIHDVPGAFSFENEDSGINFVVKRNGFVEDVSLDPPKSKSYLKCQVSQGQVGESTFYLHRTLSD